jgi:hypothetical protein
VLSGYAILDGAELDRPVLLAEWTRHAVSEITVHDLATGERVGQVPLPGLGTVGGASERPEGGTRRGSSTPTTRRPRWCCASTRGMPR